MCVVGIVRNLVLLLRWRWRIYLPVRTQGKIHKDLLQAALRNRVAFQAQLLPASLHLRKDRGHRVVLSRDLDPDAVQILFFQLGPGQLRPYKLEQGAERWVSIQHRHEACGDNGKGFAVTRPEVLWAAQALHPPVDHDAEPGTEGLTLVHAVRCEHDALACAPHARTHAARTQPHVR